MSAPANSETLEKAQHTPGPWHVDRQVFEWHSPHGVRALAIWRLDKDRSGSPVAWVHPYLHLGDPFADAHLIAAAPDLLAALRGMVGLHDNPTPYDSATTITAARAAIRKAEGK